MASRGARAQEPLYVICRSGGRSAQACKAFANAGFENVVNVDGGTLAWIAAGLPVNRGTKKMISLERQVRIVAGLLIVAGTVLAAAVNPWFLVIPGFVGAGLTFAGLSNTCGIGMILAKMPWNKALKSEDCSQGGCFAGAVAVLSDLTVEITDHTASFRDHAAKLLSLQELPAEKAEPLASGR